MINKRLESLTNKNSSIRAMFEEGKRLSKVFGEENVYDFSLGNPCVEPPTLVQESIVNTVSLDGSSKIHGYMSNAGYPFVRKAVADQLNSINNTGYSENNIIMTVGAAGGLNCILQTLINPRDEVIVVAPFFVEYINYIENWQGKAVIVEANPLDFTLSPKNILKGITERTKAIIINNPNNPTGVVYNENNILNVCDILRQKEKEFGHPIYIISDEPYRELVYDNAIVPFIPSFYNNTIIVYSWSKSLSLPGERIGYVAISPRATDADLIFRACCISNRIIGFVNAPSLMQHVVNNSIDIKPNIFLYDENRKLLYSELSKIGFDCVYPLGAFYLWMKCPCDEKVFVDKAKSLNILLVGGNSFYGKGYVRIAYCVPKIRVQNSIKAFQNLWRIAKKA